MHVKEWKNIDYRSDIHIEMFIKANMIFAFYGCLSHLRLYTRFSKWEWDEEISKPKYRVRYQDRILTFKPELKEKTL